MVRLVEIRLTAVPLKFALTLVPAAGVKGTTAERAPVTVGAKAKLSEQ